MTQSNNYIEFEGAYYVLDIEALYGYIIGNDKENIIERTKSESWVATEPLGGNNMVLQAKDITEVTTPRREGNAPLRAEIVKMMLQILLLPVSSEEGELREIKSLDASSMSFGQIMSFNTLVSEGIIKEV